MEQIIEIVLSYASIWVPSIVAILGVISTILVALNKTKEAFAKLNKDETLKELKTQLTKVIKDNQELRAYEKVLVDEMTKIKNYVEDLKKEGKL